MLWFDLMFDVQVLGHGDAVLPEAVLASIAGYYRRVTTEAYPMNRLVGAVMVVGIGGAIVQLVRGRRPADAASLLLLVAPVVLAFVQVFPDAVRLGGRADSVEIQSALARAICTAHIACVASLVLFLGFVLGRRER